MARRQTNLQFHSANLGWAVKKIDPNGSATEILMSGGGPALTTDANTPYPTLDGIWIYDVAKETHTVVGNFMTSRVGHQVTEWNDCRFLVTGSVNFDPSQINPPHRVDVLNTTEIINFSSANAVATKVTMNEHRAGCTTTLITTGPNAGKVLIAGDTKSDANHRISEVDDIATHTLQTTGYFDPTTNTFTSTANMPNAVAFPGLVALPGNEALVIGGAIGELEDPIPVADVHRWFNGNWTQVLDMQISHAGGVTDSLEDGTNYMGGDESGTVATNKAETYSP